MYAGLGRAADATREHVRYHEIRRAHGDTTSLRTDAAWDAAINLPLLGQPEAAIDSLRVVAADTGYHYMSPALLRVDPFWTSIRENPRFAQLAAVTGTAGPTD